MTLQEQYAYLTKGCVDVVREADLRRQARRVRGRVRRAPAPSRSDSIRRRPISTWATPCCIRKMKHFQDLGHDRRSSSSATSPAMIGDPTGRSKARPPLTREEIDANAETYKSQVFKLLDPDRTVVDFNSRLARRDLGSRRPGSGSPPATAWPRCWSGGSSGSATKSGRPITIHEFLYPLAQAYDSVSPADRRRARRDRSALQPERRARHHARRTTCRAAGGADDTPLLVGLDGDREDVEVGRQLRRHHGAARRHVRQAHVHRGPA